MHPRRRRRRDERGLLADHLRRPGHRVLEACGGEEALALARREQLDLALLDVRVPRMDGVAALRALRASEAGRRLPGGAWWRPRVPA